MEICVNSGLPIAMVPCLHQSNVHVKRKQWERRAQKCKPFVGAKIVRTYTFLQTTLYHAAPYSADNVNLRKFGVTYHDGTMFIAKQCSYQKEAIYSNQERMMTSFLLLREEEERVTAKKSKQAESPACTKNRTHLPASSQFHDLQPHNAVLPS